MTDFAITQEGRLGGDRYAQLEQAARGFEEYFLKEILKQAQSQEGDQLFGRSPAMKQFEQLLHDGLAERAAGGLGLADRIVEDLAAKARLTRPDRDAGPPTSEKGP